MSLNKTSADKTGLEEAIDKVLLEMSSKASDSEEFSKMVDQLEKLHKMKIAEKPESRVDINTLVAIGGNLAGIVAILGFERAHVVTSKALGFVLKSRV